MALDLTKPLQTREGTPATLISTNYRSIAGRNLVVIIHEALRDLIACYELDGKCATNAKYDLVNVPVVHSLWINIWHHQNMPNPAITVHKSRAEAEERMDLSDSLKRVACLNLKYTEGEGL